MKLDNLDLDDHDVSPRGIIARLIKKKNRGGGRGMQLCEQQGKEKRQHVSFLLC